VVHNGSPSRLAVLSVAARTFPDSGPDGLRPCCRSKSSLHAGRTVHALGKMVCDGAGSSSSSQEPRTAPGAETLGCSGSTGYPGRP
jgi:hypothetical protein